jgi:hypothetical protein
MLKCTRKVSSSPVVKVPPTDIGFAKWTITEQCCVYVKNDDDEDSVSGHGYFRGLKKMPNKKIPDKTFYRLTCQNGIYLSLFISQLLMCML